MPVKMQNTVINSTEKKQKVLSALEIVKGHAYPEERAELDEFEAKINSAEKMNDLLDALKEHTAWLKERMVSLIGVADGANSSGEKYDEIVKWVYAEAQYFNVRTQQQTTFKRELIEIGNTYELKTNTACFGMELAQEYLEKLLRELDRSDLERILRID
ncbi:MAG: hypothetical protein ACP5T3_02910 [Candidatus Micrarchaeia archaeon]